MIELLGGIAIRSVLRYRLRPKTPAFCPAQVHADRAQFFKDVSAPFYGANRPDSKVSQGLRDSFWMQGMLAGLPAAYDCIKAFSETDFTEDLKKLDVPTLIIAGDDDQIVPIADAALLQAKLIKGAELKVYKGAPHGLCQTLKDEINAESPRVRQGTVTRTSLNAVS